MSQLLFWVGPLATLAVSPWWNYDPINPIKLAIIGTAAGTLSAYLFLSRKQLVHRLGWPLVFFSGMFLSALASTLLFSDAPLGQQIWGTFGRNTGFICYFSLLALLMGSVALSHQQVSKILQALFSTGIFVGAYMFLQFLNYDPINWSLHAPFGTLGNVNFSSAFMGMAAIATTGFCLNTKLVLQRRIVLCIVLSLEIFAILITDSIQGLFTFGSGVLVMLGIIVLARKNSILKFSFVTFSLILILSSGAAVFGQGPLSRLIFQETTVFRADYMHAGLEMTLLRPWTGVGLDSYGDWYRELRGVISAYRTTLNRTSNSAHNVFLDISSNGGFPLLISYLLILFLALYISARKLTRMIKNRQIDIIFVTAFSTWIGYLVQSLVSINQIGVGIWGWLLTGALISFRNEDNESAKNDKKSTSRLRRPQKGIAGENLLPAGMTLVVFLFAVSSLVISSQAWITDKAYRGAKDSGAFPRLVTSAERMTSNAFFLSDAISIAGRSGSDQEANRLAREMLKRYPRDIFAQLFILGSKSATGDERTNARNMIQKLDPNFPCLNVDFKNEILRKIRNLPEQKQVELLRSWGLLTRTDRPVVLGDLLQSVDQTRLEAKLIEFCPL